MEIIFLQATPGLSHHLPDRIPHTLTWFSKQDELMDCTLAGDKEVQKYRADMLFRILENHLGYSRYHPLASVTTLVHLRNSSKHPGDASPSVWILYSFKIPQGRIFKIDFQVLDIKGQCKVFIAQLETVLQLIKTVWFCFICGIQNLDIKFYITAHSLLLLAGEKVSQVLARKFYVQGLYAFMSEL